MEKFKQALFDLRLSVKALKDEGIVVRFVLANGELKAKFLSEVEL